MKRPTEEEVFKVFGKSQNVTVNKEITCLQVAIKDGLEHAILLGAVIFCFGYPGMSKNCTGKGELPTRCSVPVETLRQSCVQAYQSPPKLPNKCEGKITHQNNLWEFQGFYFGESIRLQLFPETTLDPNVIEFHC